MRRTVQYLACALTGPMALIIPMYVGTAQNPANWFDLPIDVRWALVSFTLGWGIAVIGAAVIAIWRQRG